MSFTLLNVELFGEVAKAVLLPPDAGGGDLG